MILAAMVVISLFLVPGIAYVMEIGTDRPGMNYRNFDLERNHPALCERECLEDPACQAWTYVKPGIQGPKARCWLKNGIPAAVKNPCCVSGFKQQAFKPPIEVKKQFEKRLDPPVASSQLQNADQPDLIVSEMHLIEFCKLSFTVKNIGSAGLTNNFVASVGPPNQPNVHKEKFFPGDLGNPGGFETYTFSNYMFPAMNEVKLVVNSDASIAEKNYSNNSLTKTGLECLPDLAIVDILATKDCKIKIIINNVGIAVVQNWVTIHLKGQTFQPSSKTVAPQNINHPGGQMIHVSDVVLGSQAQPISASVHMQPNTGISSIAPKEKTMKNNSLSKVLSCTQ